jgi:WW domain-containing oxidoreductase
MSGSSATPEVDGTSGTTVPRRERYATSQASCRAPAPRVQPGLERAAATGYAGGMLSTAPNSPASAAPRRFERRHTADDVLAGLDLRGKTIAITGANAGIGLESARALSAHGARVLVGGRSPARCDESIAALRALVPSGDLQPFVCDLGSLKSVQAAVQAAPERIDAVICNAGLFGGGHHQTEDGFERAVGVCHIGHAALVLGLLPRLKASRGRVVMVSSESHRTPRRLDFNNFPMSRERYRDLVAYGQAKLCNVLFANELWHRFGKDGVTANSLHPGGLMSTSIGRSSALAKVVMTVARPFTKTLPQGASTQVYLATAPELEGVGGKYFADNHEKAASKEAQDPAVAARMWDLTMGWLKQHGVL